MSGTRGLIKEALNGDLNEDIINLADTLDHKVELRNFWISDLGKRMEKKLHDDAFKCLKSLYGFETLSIEEIRGLLAKYKADMDTLSSIRESDNIQVIQEQLDNAVKSRAEEMRGR